VFLKVDGQPLHQYVKNEATFFQLCRTLFRVKVIFPMSAVGVRRGKAALFQWVQVPPG